MFCSACMPQPLEFEIDFSSPENMKHLPSVQRYVEEVGLLTRASSSRLTVKEAAMKGLLDYINQHMDTEQLQFRIEGENWRPIRDAAELLDAQWIDRLIDEEAVHFHFQPIVNGDRSLYAYEMLARFKDENEEVIPPYPVFEAAKSRNRLYALDRVCRVNAIRQSPSAGRRVFINFIPTSIYSPEHCLSTTVRLSQELGIDPSSFVFEVVETEQVSDFAHLKRILDYYEERGFRYALDDVGAGFNTIETIRQMKPYYTKLDRQYVEGVHLNDRKQLVALSVLEATRAVGGIPLAEGIEEEQEFLWLKEAGFELFQGYLFGKPGPLEVVEED